MGPYTRVFGILNLSQDSFSDGGEVSGAEDAKKKGDWLLSLGAFGLDIGAQASNPQALRKTAQEEWRDLSPVIDYFQSQGKIISVDTFSPQVQTLCLEKGVSYLNDITGFTQPESFRVFRNLPKEKLPFLIVMFSHTGGMASTETSHLTPERIISNIQLFFEDRKKELLSWGIPENKMIWDPGMGFFLGSDPELSFEVLRQVPVLLQRFPNLYVSVSRKSFLSAVVGSSNPKDRDLATLLVEDYLLNLKIPYLRTHNVLKLNHRKMLKEKLSST